MRRPAAACGLHCFARRPGQWHSGRTCLSKRYDRRVDDQGLVRRLHQEDICQALGIVPEHKYAAEGGPTFPAMFALLRRATQQPALAALTLGCRHLQRDSGQRRCARQEFQPAARRRCNPAPFYDLLCTLAYPDLSPRFAMKVGGTSTLEDIGASTRVRFRDRHRHGRAIRARPRRATRQRCRGRACTSPTRWRTSVRSTWWNSRASPRSFACVQSEWPKTATATPRPRAPDVDRCDAPHPDPIKEREADNRGRLAEKNGRSTSGSTPFLVVPSRRN